MDLFLGVLYALLGEGIYIFVVFFISEIINYIEDPNADYRKGIWLVIVYAVTMFISMLFRNYYYFTTSVLAVKMRKTLLLAMYDKIGKLSIKSLVETNSGKLITLISSDFFSVERGMMMMISISLAAPFINLICYILLGYIIGWQYSLAVFGVWIVCLFL